MSEFFISTGLTLLGLVIIGGAVYGYLRKIRHVPHEQALQKAIQLAYQIWQASDFVAPRALLDANVARSALREAGLVLKAELVGKATYAGMLPIEAAMPHAELALVDPEDLAKGVQEKLAVDHPW